MIKHYQNNDELSMNSHETIYPATDILLKKVVSLSTSKANLEQSSSHQIAIENKLKTPFSDIQHIKNYGSFVLMNIIKLQETISNEYKIEFNDENLYYSFNKWN